MTVTQDRADRLDEEVLAYVDGTAPRYDRGNSFRTASLPANRRGVGLDLGEVSRLFGRMAYVAPATAATRAVGRRQT